MLVVAATFAATAHLVAHLTGGMPPALGWRYAGKLLAMLTFFAPWFALLAVFRERATVDREGQGRVPVGAAWRLAGERFAAAHLRPIRMVDVALALTAVYLVMEYFSLWKVLAPQRFGFRWDMEFAAFDRFLHGGRHPWEYLRPALASTTLVRTIDAIYLHGWLFFMSGILIWQALRPPSADRTRYFIVFAATWALLGTFMSALFLSGGPVYYGRLAGEPSEFAPLLEALYAAGPLNATALQDLLWSLYVGGRMVQDAGISAMPSLHIAMVVLGALAVSQQSRWAGAVVWIFAGVIFFGSILLAWHYAVDGYVALVVVIALWWVVGRVQQVSIGFARAKEQQRS